MSKMLDSVEVAAEMDALNDLKGDAEAFHGREDDLMLRIISEIAAGHPDPQRICQAFVAGRDPDATRWYA